MVLVTVSLSTKAKRILDDLAHGENRSASNMVETLILRAAKNDNETDL